MDSVPHSSLNAHLDRPRNGPRRSAAASRDPRVDRGALRRLRQMSLAEVAYRGWQEATKWIERVSPPVVHEPELLLRTQAPELARPHAALRSLREEIPGRFFAGVAHAGTVPTLWRESSDDCHATVAAADALLEQRFNLLGYQMLWFGNPIDWHIDPLASRRAPQVHWSLLDPLDARVVGDSKVVWELNRHQWLVRLAHAFALTGDERYAVACVSAIDAWIDANPPGVGINWASSLEVAYRLMSWSWTALLIRDSAAVTDRWAVKMLAAIWRHATHVRRYLSYYFSPNTHLTGEALGLVYAGTLFPEFHDAARWRALGAEILIAQGPAQISSDGVHFEQSTCYQRYTAETYLQFLMLAARNGMSVPADLIERTERVVEFLLAVRLPDGSIPSIGDGDGGALFPLLRRSAGDARAAFAVAAHLFRRPDFAWAAGGATPEAIWSLGPDTAGTFGPANAPPAGPPSQLFRSGGYAIMRTGWDQNAHQMIVDVGPLGCPISSGHGHADLLSIQCAIFGEPFLVDAGTYCYTGDSQWRDFFRSTAAHSTVLVDGEGQARPAGPFRWHQRPNARVRRWYSDASFDFLDADHDAYLRLGQPVACRRRVIFAKPDLWLVIDDISGEGTHTVELNFQFAPMHVTMAEDSWARAASPRGHILWMKTFSTVPASSSIARGELTPPRGWISRDYGQREPAPALVHSCTTTLPWRALTVLVPGLDSSISPPPICVRYDGSGAPAGLASSRTIRFDNDSVLITSPFDM